MAQTERGSSKNILAKTKQEFRSYLKAVLADRAETAVEHLHPLILSYEGTAVLLGEGADDLRKLTGRRMDICFGADNVQIFFSPSLDLIAQAYRIGAKLLQTSGSMADRELVRLREEESAVLTAIEFRGAWF